MVSLNNFYTVLLVIVLWVLDASAADTLFKCARGFDSRFWTGVVLYALSGVAALYVYREAKFGYVTLVWCAVCVLVNLTIASIVFHEKLTGLRVASAVLAIAAVALSE